MRILPEKAWWGPTKPGGSMLTAQPVAHLVGGALWALFGLLLWWPSGDWHIVAFAAGGTFYWELRVWEPEPDGTYPFRWLVYDVATAILAAMIISALAGLLT